jgi:hypothetical protein
MTGIDAGQFADPRWRLSNHYTIRDKAGRSVPFRPNGAQLAPFDNLHSANIILKARQLGFTTLRCLIYPMPASSRRTPGPASSLTSSTTPRSFSATRSNIPMTSSTTA